MVKGIIGKKVGMTQLFDENGKVIPVTVIEAGPCTVVQKKTVESDGYQAVQLGFGEVSAKKVNKAAAGHFKKANVARPASPRARATRASSSATASTACARATAPAPSHGTPAPTARLRPRAASTPASACPATWALCGSPCRT